MSTPLPADTAATGSTATGFATAILQALGAPVNPANVGSLNDWFALEGGGGANNPLNTTLATSGSTGSINSVGVQSYGTPAEGVAATVDTLDSGSYSAIVAALKSGAGLTGGSASVAQELSAWSGGGYSSVTGGTGTVQGIQGNVPGVSAPGAVPSGAVNLTTATTPTDALSLGAAVQDAATSLTTDISGGGGGTTGTAGAASATGASAAGSTSASLLSNPLDIVSALARIAKDFNTLVTLINALLADIEWLFVPSNWVRIFSFLFGVGALLPGLWALMKTGSGQQGDITMAIGILLVTFAGVMLFIAFHNLPTDVTDLGGLLTYISEGITAGAAPTAGDTAFGPASSAAGAPTDVTAGSSIQNAVTNPDLTQLWPKRSRRQPR